MLAISFIREHGSLLRECIKETLIECDIIRTRTER